MKPTEDTPIEVKDERLSDFLWIDREIRRPSPNGQTWQALLQPLCVSIYVCLCGHAAGEKGKPNKPRESFPSYATIARECGISRRAAIEGISTLISFGFLRKGESTEYRTNIFFIQSREKWCVAAEKGRKTRNDKGTPRKIVNDIHHTKDDVIVNDIHSDSESYSPLIVNDIHSDSESYSPEVESLSKVNEEKSGSTSSSSKSSPSIERAEKTEEEEGISALNHSSFSLSPEQIQTVQNFYLLGKEEVEGFLIRNKTSFEELSKCLNAIMAKDMSGSNVRYVDFQGRPIQRPLGFIFKNGWITAGRACVPTLHATEIKKDRNRWNNADVVESELEKTKRRIGIA